MASEIDKSIPGYADILKEGGATTKKMLDQAGSFLSGEIPQDVQDQVYRSSAYKSFAGGYGGSQMSGGLAARNLGLTSLDLISRGANLASQGGNAAQLWSHLAGQQTFDPSSMFVTPGQQAAITARNNEMTQATQQFKYNVEAAPDPVASGISNTIMSLVGSYLGGGLGGGGGGAAQGGKTSFPLSSGANFSSSQNIPYNTNMPWYQNATSGTGW